MGHPFQPLLLIMHPPPHTHRIWFLFLAVHLAVPLLTAIQFPFSHTSFLPSACLSSYTAQLAVWLASSSFTEMVPAFITATGHDVVSSLFHWKWFLPPSLQKITWSGLPCFYWRRFLPPSLLMAMQSVFLILTGDSFSLHHCHWLCAWFALLSFYLASS